ncbi:hypothetical protein J2788_004826 [Variovorax paradoxus]|jgi:hypothetical protein|nr:hypothetical protein [Variovorax paradoxus]
MSPLPAWQLMYSSLWSSAFSTVQHGNHLAPREWRQQRMQ